MLSNWLGSFTAKLYLAFSVIASLTLFATAFALYLFSKYSEVVSTTGDKAIPGMLAALQLSERSALLAAMAPMLAVSEGKAHLRGAEVSLDFLADEINSKVDELSSYIYGTDYHYQAIREASGAIFATLADLKDVTLTRLSLQQRKLTVLAEIRKLQGELFDTLSPIVYGATSLTNLFARRIGRRNAAAVKQWGEINFNLLIVLMELRMAIGQIANVLERDEAEIDRFQVLKNDEHCETVVTKIRTHLNALWRSNSIRTESDLLQLTDLMDELTNSDPCEGFFHPNHSSTRNQQGAQTQVWVALLDSLIASQKEQFLATYQETLELVRSTPMELASDAVRKFRYVLDIKAEGNLLIALLTAVSDADNKHTVSNFFNRFKRSLSAFRDAIDIFKNSALAGHNPVLAGNVLEIERQLTALGRSGKDNLFNLRLSELAVAERIQALIADHRAQATQLTSHVSGLIDVVRQEVTDLQNAMAQTQVTANSILVAVCIGSLLIAALIVHFTARLLSRHESDLRDAKTTAELANRELEAFNYSVSHDLRAPLRALNGFSAALLEDYGEKLDETGKRYLHFLQEGSREMNELINGLLKLSRSTRGELVREQVDLSALAQEVAKGWQEANPERLVSIEIVPQVEAEGDPQLLKTVMENLIGNAWKYTSKTPSARIEFGSEHNGSETIYYVRDNGVGFDMTYANKLFLPFQRLHRTGEFEGSGIGLATVQRIIHRHSGRIWAQSAVGEGATFIFTLEASME